MRSRWAVLVLLAVLAGCETRGAGPPSVSRTTEAREPDASAQVSCSHFRNVMGDVGQGLLTDAELRDKLKEVHSSASVSEEPGIAASATAMLAAITTGTAEDLLDAAKQFDRACDKAGL